MEQVKMPRGYVLGENQRFEDLLAVQAELFRSEGLDPEWPGFDKPVDDQDDQAKDKPQGIRGR
jgi:hypothetical protein